MLTSHLPCLLTDMNNNALAAHQDSSGRGNQPHNLASFHACAPFLKLPDDLVLYGHLLNNNPALTDNPPLRRVKPGHNDEGV